MVDDKTMFAVFNIDDFISKLTEEEKQKLFQDNAEVLAEAARYYDGTNEKVSTVMDYVRKLDSSELGYRVRLVPRD